jgi:hypothetical protein
MSILRTREVAPLLQLVRLDDRVAVGIVWVVTGQDLFHLVLGSRAARHDRERPLRERLILFAPVLLVRIPRAAVFEPERCQAERGHIDAARGDLGGQIRVLAVCPALARLHGENLARNHTPQSFGAQRDRLGRPKDPAARSPLLEARNDEVQRRGVGSQLKTLQ